MKRTETRGAGRLEELEREVQRLRDLLRQAGVNADVTEAAMAAVEAEHREEIAATRDKTAAAYRRTRSAEKKVAVAEGVSAELRVLLAELHHRMRNMIAMVLAISLQSLRRASTVDQARGAVEARLLALGNAHDLLVTQDWSGASLSNIVSSAIQPYNDPEFDRFRVSGPEIRLSSRAALAFAMTMHELGTNAIKYGALSTESGIVEISWRVNDEARQFQFTWIEIGGPAVSVPSHRGFGSRVIETSLAGHLGGKAQLLYEPSGLIFSFAAPLDVVQSSAD